MLLCAACTPSGSADNAPAISSSATDKAAAPAPTWIGKWKITALDGKPLKAFPGATDTPNLTIGDDAVGIYAGCNSGGGSALIADDRLYLYGIMSTLIGCADLTDQENRAFSIPTSQPRLVADGAGRARLESSKGTLQLERMTDTPAPQTALEPTRLPLSGTRWTVHTVDGAVLPRTQKESALLAFDADRWTFTMPGCGSFGGGWVQSASDEVTLTAQSDSAPACATATLKALIDAPLRYRIGPNSEWIAAGGGHWFTGERSLDQEQRAMRQVVGRWQLVALDGKAVSKTVRTLEFAPTLYFVNDGCRHHEGIYIARGSNIFWRGSGVVSANQCSPDPEGAAMLERLGSSVAFATADRLRLINDKGSADYVRIAASNSKDLASARLAPGMRFRLDNGADLHIIDNRRVSITLPCGTMPGDWNNRNAVPRFSMRVTDAICENDPQAIRLSNLFSGDVQLRIGPNRDIALFVSDHLAIGATIPR